MKVALVVHDFDPAYGQGRYCVELASRLAPHHALTVYANRFAADPPRGVEVVAVPAWRRSALLTVFSFLAGAESHLRRHAHDVVHAQGLTCWRADVITAHICNAARARVSPPVDLRAKLFTALVNPVEARFYRQRRARHLIAISRRVAGEIAHHYGWTRPATVIHHGVDTRHFRPPEGPEAAFAARSRFGLPPTGWVWLFVGEAVKGLDACLEQLPNFPNARLLAVSRSEREPHEALARRLGVADRLHWPGPQEDVAEAYRAADVFVYPSRYDSFGMVVSEAMASGLPVIVGQDIGAAETIEPGVHGFCIDPAHRASLRNALDRLAHSPDLARTLGAAARRLAKAQSWDACASATHAVYAALQPEARGGS